MYPGTRVVDLLGWLGFEVRKERPWHPDLFRRCFCLLIWVAPLEMVQFCCRSVGLHSALGSLLTSCLAWVAPLRFPSPSCACGELAEWKTSTLTQPQ